MLNGLNFQPIRFTSFFNVVMVWNRGVSFGLFSDGAEATRWLLVGLSLVICGALVVWLRQLTRRLPVVAVGLVIGGALGNALDRVLRGAVADFFDFHIGALSWPAFNIADAGITVGVALLLLDALLTPSSSSKVKP